MRRKPSSKDEHNVVRNKADDLRKMAPLNSLTSSRNENEIEHSKERFHIPDGCMLGMLKPTLYPGISFAWINHYSGGNDFRFFRNSKRPTNEPKPDPFKATVILARRFFPL